MLIKYYLDGKEYASRNRNFIPKINEMVRFKGTCYLIENVVWIEDCSVEHVAIDIGEAI
jgi:hypothetical protein